MFASFYIAATAVYSTEPVFWIIAHRGASAECPENTLASVRRAWQVGADAVEIDVHLTKDQRLLVIHDATTSRTTGKDYVVSETLASVLRTLDAGSWYSKKFNNEKLPLLEEVLASVPPGKRLFVEIKSGPDSVSVLKRVLEKSPAAPRVVIISFSSAVISEAARLLPNTPRYWLRGTIQDRATKAPLPHPVTWIDVAKSISAHGLDVHHAGLTPEFVKAVHDAGMDLYVWTVNDPTIAKKVKALGCDGITTDDPRKMLETIGRTSK